MQKVAAFIHKHQLLASHDKIVVGVSGGPDSIALLHYLHGMKKEIPLSILAVSIDHGLRGAESRKDSEYVGEVCEGLSLPFELITVDVNVHKQKKGMGTQEAARELRYEAFASVMKREEADVLALGHHGDDQTETLFMQLIRGVAPGSITGMPVTRDFAGGRIIRPFLSLTKPEIETYCKDHDLLPRRDPSNEEETYSRNSFRHRILPYLKEQNPKIHEHIQKYSERRQEDEAFLDEKARTPLKEVHFSGEGAVLSIKSLKRYPIALQRRTFHLILNYLYNTQVEDITYVHEELFLQLMDGDRGNSSLDFPKGLTVTRAYDEVSFTFEKTKRFSPLFFELYPGDYIEWPEGGRITAERSAEMDDTSLYEFVCDMNHLSFPLIIRTRRDGDRIQPAGMKGTKKIKDIFIDQKIPKDQRDRWPIVTDNDGRIVWIPGIKKAEVDADTDALLHLTYNRAGRRNFHA